MLNNRQMQTPPAGDAVVKTVEHVTMPFALRAIISGHVPEACRSAPRGKTYMHLTAVINLEQMGVI